MSNDRITCDEAREKLPLHVGGDLDAGVLEAVTAHLAGCSACAVLADESALARRELVSALRERAAEALVPGAGGSLWSSIRETLHQEGLIHAPRPVLAPTPARVRPGRRWARALVPLAAAAALVAMVQLVEFGGGSEGTAPERGGLIVMPHQAPTEVPTVLVSETPEVGGMLRRVPATDDPIFLPAPYLDPQAMGGSQGRGGIQAVNFTPRGMK